MKTLDEITTEVIDDAYGGGTRYAEPNYHDEVGLTLALARGDVDEADVRELIRAAIEADRAQHDLSYAHQIIDRHDARAVIWERGDAESVLDEMISDEEIEQPTVEGYAKIVDDAMRTRYWRSLSDCQDSDWDAIREAIREVVPA